MMNSETHRQFYLGMTGVRTWYARRPLPGAAPSPEFFFPEESQPQLTLVEPVQPARSHSEPATVKPATVAGRSVNLQALMAPDEGKVAIESEPAPLSSELDPEGSRPQLDAHVQTTAPVAEPVAARDNIDVSMHLGFWSTTQYLLVSQWSSEASDRLQESLAQNLLKALNQDGVAEFQTLQWPVFRNRQIPGNSSEDFREVLTRLMSSYENHSVILLGVLAGESEERRSAVLEALLPNVGVDFPCSLAQLSAAPDLKRDLWSSLKSCYLG